MLLSKANALKHKALKENSLTSFVYFCCREVIGFFKVLIMSRSFGLLVQFAGCLQFTECGEKRVSSNIIIFFSAGWSSSYTELPSLLKGRITYYNALSRLFPSLDPHRMRVVELSQPLMV